MKVSYMVLCCLAVATTGSAQIKKDATVTRNVAWYIELKSMGEFVDKWSKENHANAGRIIEVVVNIDGKEEEMTFEELKRRLGATPSVPTNFLCGCTNPVSGQGWGTVNNGNDAVLRP